MLSTFFSQENHILPKPEINFNFVIPPNHLMADFSELYNKGITVQRFPLTIALEKKIDDDFMILINFNKLLRQSTVF
jgi:hypothetical protein